MGGGKLRFMIVFPFLYFSTLLAYILYKKKVFEVSAYLVSLYAFTSFFSILIDIKHLRSFDTIKYDIGVTPTLLYCFLLTLSIWPFYRFDSQKIMSIKLKGKKLFDYIVYFYFICFLIILITFYTAIIKILNSDLGQLRLALSRGESINDVNISGHPIIIIANIFGGYSLIMLLFYFYSVCFLKRKKVFNTILFLSSLSMILIGIIGVDRSKVIYWMITYGLMIVLFWRKMEKEQHRNILISSLIILSLVITYFLMLTFSRFGERDTGSTGSLISYSGQSFINFCYFFDEVNFRDFTLQRIFPLFYRLFINNGIKNASDLNAIISLQTHTSIGVFSTFIGDIMVASGRLVGILYCFIFYFVTTSSISTSKNKSNIYFHHLLLIFCFITVPMLGIFVYFYSDFSRTIPLLCFLFYYVYLRFKKKPV